MEEGYDVNISTPYNITSTSVINLTSNKAVNFNTPRVNLTNDLFVLGSIIGLNIGVKSPLYFTTNRNMTINGTVFSVYDIDLSKYTKSILLDGLSIRQFRIRTWTSEADFEYPLNPISRYDISCLLKMVLVFMQIHSF